MNKRLRFIFLFLAVLIIPSLCQASVTILTNTNQDHTIISGSDELIYGTSESNQIILESGAKAELINFPGQNDIQIQSDSNLFTASRSGTVVSFEGSDGTVLNIPATSFAQTISFVNIEPLTLSMYDNQVMLDDQIIGTTPIDLGNPELLIIPSIRNVESISGTTTFSVSNTGTDTMAWTAEVTSGRDWLTISSSGSGYDAGTIICQYEANTETAPRTGTIQITAPYATGSPVNVMVEQGGSLPLTDGCGAYVAPGIWMKFDCYNLAAIGKTTDENPFIPSWQLIGGYWQWGRKGPFSNQWFNTNTANFAHGPAGPNSHEANAEEIAMWGQTPAPEGAWSDAEKTINDPCPSGFRVPTKSQWKGVVENNSQRTIGTWSISATNYNSARFFGDSLMLPAAGARNYTKAALSFRGVGGYYWSSTESTNDTAELMSFTSSLADTENTYNNYGYSVRCIAEPLTMSKDQVTIESGESETVNISGGTGNYTSVSSGNGGVAEAKLETNTITVMGVSQGTVTITVADSGGSTAFLTAMIDTSPYSCGAYVTPFVWKEFDCYNLAAIGKTVYDDPFTPSWRLIGGYWQWGRKGPDPNQWHKTNTEHFAHGPYAEGANSDSISGWSSTPAPDDAWSDVEKTPNDPCPSDFRVPTKSQWDGVLENNIQLVVGTWSESATNYNSARFFGNDLMLPAAGYRYSRSWQSSRDGSLYSRGSNGRYWSSSQLSNTSWSLSFSSGELVTDDKYWRFGFSVRCIAE